MGSTDSHCCHRAPVGSGIMGGGSITRSPEGRGGAARRGGRLRSTVLTAPDVRALPDRYGPASHNGPSVRHTRGMSEPAKRPGDTSPGESDPPGLDLTRLADYLREAQPDLLHGQLSAELIAGGKSNLTYRVSDANRSIVLRRPPL